MNKHENLRSVFEKIKESVRPSFYANAEDVRQSLLFDFFAESDKPLAAECCLIITEVLRNIPDGVITVDGEERAAPADLCRRARGARRDGSASRPAV